MDQLGLSADISGGLYIPGNPCSNAHFHITSHTQPDTNSGIFCAGPNTDAYIFSFAQSNTDSYTFSNYQAGLYAALHIEFDLGSI